jgi:malate dehydrogenase (oxaloacetate-decarboxylating)
LGIPVFHDDQHGTAIVLLAALINAAQVTEKKLNDLRVVVNGAGAAGTAIAKLISGIGVAGNEIRPVGDVIICDSKGAISRSRDGLSPEKTGLLEFSNKDNKSGTLKEVIKGADVFIGVSKGNVITTDDVKAMAKNSIILAMANPTPEIMPEEAIRGGAAVVGTGRSDFANQVNNVLVFPGIFRGALDARAPRINGEMKVAAALALAGAVDEISPENILPHPLDRTVAPRIAKHVRAAAKASFKS